MNKIYLSLLLVSFSYGQTVDFRAVLDLTINNNKELKTQKLNIESSKLNIKQIDAIHKIKEPSA